MTQAAITQQIIALQKTTEKATKTKAAAQKYLQDAGIIPSKKESKFVGIKKK